jgi:hypothetical protein
MLISTASGQLHRQHKYKQQQQQNMIQQTKNKENQSVK